MDLRENDMKYTIYLAEFMNGIECDGCIFFTVYAEEECNEPYAICCASKGIWKILEEV